ICKYAHRSAWWSSVNPQVLSAMLTGCGGNIGARHPLNAPFLHARTFSGAEFAAGVTRGRSHDSASSFTVRKMRISAFSMSSSIVTATSEPVLTAITKSRIEWTSRGTHDGGRSHENHGGGTPGARRRQLPSALLG